MPAAPIIAFASWVGSAVAGIGAAVGLGGIGAAIGGAAANLLVGLSFANGIVAGLGAWGTVLGVASMFSKPKLMSSTAMSGAGSQIEFKGDPAAGVPLVLNRTGYSGKVVHVTSNVAAKNTHVFYLSILSAGQIEAVESFWAGGEQVNFGVSPLPIDTGLSCQSGKYAGHLDMHVQVGYKGPEGEGPFVIVSRPEAEVPEWTRDHRLSGLAAAWWVLAYNQTVYNSGRPNPAFWVIRGPPVYDPRLDSTWPGGAGGCRWEDENTWVHTGKGNAYLQALSWLAGRRAKGKLVHGVGLPRSGVDVTAFAYGANISDANGWSSCGGVADSTDDKFEVLKAMLQAGGGLPTRLGGMISCVVQAPRVSIATITKEDICGDCTITGTKTRRNRINTVTPRYRSEAEQWQIVPGQVISIPAYVAEDRGERPREIEFPLVQDKNVAAQLGAYMILDSREFEPVVIPVKPYLQGLKPGDCVTVTEPELGLMGQKLVVWQREPDPTTGAVTLTLRSETDGKHPFCLGKTDVLPGTPGLTGWDGEIDPPGVGAFVATGATVAGEGSSLPAIIVAGQRDTPYATGLLIHYRRVGDVDWIDAPSVSLGEVPILTHIMGVNEATDYEVEIAYMTMLGTTSAWRSLGVVTAGVFSFTALEAALGDNVLTIGEKMWVVPIIEALRGARAALRQRAADFGLTEINSPKLAAYENAQAALDAFLATLVSPVGWNDFSGPTDIPNPVLFRSRLEGAILTERDLQTALDGAAIGAIRDLLDDFEAISSDGVLSPKDKLMVIPALRATISARVELRAKADLYGLTVGTSAARANYEQWGVAEVDAVLATLTLPTLWSNPAGDTTIPDPFRFRDMFHYINWTTTDLQNAIAGAARSLIATLAGDGVLQPSDKITLVPLIMDLVTGRGEMRRKANSVGATELNNLERLHYEQAHQRLDQQLATMTAPVLWNNRAGDTTIPNPAAFISAVNDCVAYESSLGEQWFTLYNVKVNDIQALAQSSATAITDGVLTRSEKNTFVPYVNYLRAARAALRDQANLLGMQGLTPGQPRYLFEQAATALDNTLATLVSPVAWNNTSDITNIPNPTAFRAALENANTTTINLQTAIDNRQVTRLSTWATYSALEPGTLVGRTQWFGADGRAFDHRAVPINMPSGSAGQKSFWPLSANTGSIFVQSFIEHRSNQSFFMPAGTMGGLISDKDYDVFWFFLAQQYQALYIEGSYPYKVEPWNYLFVGRQKTAAQAGVWNPAPAAPPGSGGGGSDTGLPMQFNQY